MVADCQRAIPSPWLLSSSSKWSWTKTDTHPYRLNVGEKTIFYLRACKKKMNQCWVQNRYIPRDLEISVSLQQNRSFLKANCRTGCYLVCLPFNVRLRIYREVFLHDFSRQEFEKPIRTERNQFAILRTCRLIYHEAQIAFSRAVSYRTLVFNEYGNSLIWLLRRPPGGLCCCQANRGSFIFPCGLRNRHYMWVILRHVAFELGSPDLTTAAAFEGCPECRKRRWAFTHLMKEIPIN